MTVGRIVTFARRVFVVSTFVFGAALLGMWPASEWTHWRWSVPASHFGIDLGLAHGWCYLDFNSYWTNFEPASDDPPQGFFRCPAGDCSVPRQWPYRGSVIIHLELMSLACASPAWLAAFASVALSTIAFESTTLRVRGGRVAWCLAIGLTLFAGKAATCGTESWLDIKLPTWKTIETDCAGDGNQLILSRSPRTWNAIERNVFQMGPIALHRVDIEPPWNGIILKIHRWLAVTLLVMPLLLMIARHHWKAAHARPPWCCPACGYDLRATPERCPECGRVSGDVVAMQ